MKTSEIKLAVTTDDDGVSSIVWQADDAPEPGEQRAKAMILSLWDGIAGNAMRIDMWTKDMTVEEMNDFFFQTMLSMADSYQRATGNRELMADIKIFAREFARKALAVEAGRSRNP